VRGGVDAGDLVGELRQLVGEGTAAAADVEDAGAALERQVTAEEVELGPPVGGDQRSVAGRQRTLPKYYDCASLLTVILLAIRGVGLAMRRRRSGA